MKSLLFLTIANFTLIAGVAHATGVYLNISTSYPVGIYRAAGLDYHRGDLVAFCVGERYVNYLVDKGSIVGRGACHGTHPPLIKKVFAAVGDKVVFTRSVSVNGRTIPNSEVIATIEHALREIPVGSYVLQDDEYLLLSDYNPMSFDSRYFGPVAASNIRHKVAPLWVL